MHAILIYFVQLLVRLAAYPKNSSKVLCLFKGTATTFVAQFPDMSFSAYNDSENTGEGLNKYLIIIEVFTVMQELKIGRLNHVAIAVPDLVSASALYRDIMGADVSEPHV